MLTLVVMSYVINLRTRCQCHISRYTDVKKCRFVLMPLSGLPFSNTASDDITHRIFNTDLLYCCAHYPVKMDEKLALMTVFNTI